MSKVLDNATLDATPAVTVTNADGSVASTGTATVDGTTVSWTGALNIGQKVQIVYTVTINTDVAAGVIINNHMESSATPPGEPPITPPPVIIEHPVPGYEHSKTSDPAPGTTVRGGDKITYTVTGTNTGATVLDPVVVTDDMSKVLDNATLASSPIATVYNADGTVAATRSVQPEGTSLSWTGALQPGQRVVLVYTVKVNATVQGPVLIENRVTGEGTPPGKPPIVPPPPTTVNPVAGFEIVKSSDPASGSTVEPGQTITYTVTGTNTGATVLDPVTITDDMSQVLNHATLVGEPRASRGAVPTVSGTTLTWTGSLQPGQNVMIEYTVRVAADVHGVLLHNVVTGEGTPPGVPPIVPPPSTTEHHVPPPPLAITGMDGLVTMYVLVGALVLLVIGGAVSIIGRRRRAEQEESHS